MSVTLLAKISNYFIFLSNFVLVFKTTLYNNVLASLIPPILPGLGLWRCSIVGQAKCSKVKAKPEIGFHNIP